MVGGRGRNDKYGKVEYNTTERVNGIRNEGGANVRERGKELGKETIQNN